MTHTWRWKKIMGERFGQPCRVVCVGKLNSALRKARFDALEEAAKERSALWQLLLDRDEMGERPDPHGCDYKCKVCDCGLQEWEERHRDWKQKYRAIKEKQS